VLTGLEWRPNSFQPGSLSLVSFVSYLVLSLLVRQIRSTMSNFHFPSDLDAVRVKSHATFFWQSFFWPMLTKYGPFCLLSGFALHDPWFQNRLILDTLLLISPLQPSTPKCSASKACYQFFLSPSDSHGSGSVLLPMIHL